MKEKYDTFALVQRMRAMVYSSKDFESLWFLYQAEGLPKNISIEEFFDKRSDKSITWTSQAAKPSAAQNTVLIIQLSKHGTRRRIRRFIR